MENIWFLMLCGRLLADMHLSIVRVYEQNASNNTWHTYQKFADFAFFFLLV